MSAREVTATMTPEEIKERRAKARRSAIILGIVALAVYVTFIVLTVNKG